MTRIGELAERLRERGLLRGSPHIADDRAFAGLAFDSRDVKQDTVFVAVRGTSSDGHLFIDKAVNNGSIAVICEAVPGDGATRFPGTAFIEVTDARAALAEAAALLYGDPSRSLRIAGVTGTNGKTTVAFLIHDLLNRLGERAGLVGTVQTDLGAGPTPSRLTTPDAPALQKAFRAMQDNGCVACAMEVSSHALDQQRVRAVAFDVGIFTNLTSEHLDYHGSLDAYRTAKKRLFDSLDADTTALYNADDPSGEAVVADTRARTLSYGRGADVDLRVDVIENAISGLRLRLDGREAAFRLVGLFNAYNLAAAYGTGISLGHAPAEVIDALAQAPPVPGRFEQMQVPGERTVVVDYAHTPDALENVLQTARDLRPVDAAIWCVFGCGGDRDRSKRPMMGRIAEEYADHVIVTSDNPRTEDPEAILDEIRRGMDAPEKAAWIVDRRNAIEHAASRASRGDIVLIAGKGHETYQIVGNNELAFDDREVAKIAFDASEETGNRNTSSRRI